MPSLSKISFKLLRIVSYLVLVMLAVFVTLSLLLVFYVSPRLDQWCEPIQEVVQKHTEMPVEFGGLELSWRGFNPQLIVKDISFQESELPTPTKRLPRASIKDLRLSLQPRSILRVMSGSGSTDYHWLMFPLMSFLMPKGMSSMMSVLLPP